MLGRLARGVNFRLLAWPRLRLLGIVDPFHGDINRTAFGLVRVEQLAHLA